MDRPVLRLLCVGTGRDGTLSLWHMIQWLYDRAGCRRRAAHEYRSREFYDAFCNYRETDDRRYAEAIAAMIDECEYECVVGNGYAAVLPLFAEKVGRHATLVHLRRQDRRACVASLVRNCELFPAAHGYYSSSPLATVKRMAAFHFGEMTRRAWDALTLEEKYGWYYDKTHDLIRSARNLFADYVEIKTERLDDEDTRRRIGRLAVGGAVGPCPPVHLNAQTIDISNYPPHVREKMQWLLGRLDLSRLAEDEAYWVDYFVEKFIAWMGYQVAAAPQLGATPVKGRQETAAILRRAERLLRSRLGEIRNLESSLVAAAHGTPGLGPPC